MPVETLPKIRPAEEEATRTGTANAYSPLYNVVLLDDDMHTYAYVIEMLTTLIGCPVSWAFEMAKEVDSTGRVIIDSTTLEEAHILQEKIHSFGADWRMPGCLGSMTAIIEPTYGV